MEMIESIWVVPSYARACALRNVYPVRVRYPEGDIRARAGVKNNRPTEGMGVKTVAIEHGDRARFARRLKSVSAHRDPGPPAFERKSATAPFEGFSQRPPAEPFLPHRVDRAYSLVKKAISIALDIA